MTTKEKTEITKETKDSIRQPVWHVMVLGFFSFGLYLIYWFYKTWRDLRNQARDNDPENPVLKDYPGIRPWFRTLVFFIPVISIPLYLTPFAEAAVKTTQTVWVLVLGLIVANLFKDIASLIPDESSWARINSVRASFVLSISIAMCLVFCTLDNICYLLYLLVVIPIGIVQHWLNQYYEASEKEVLALRYAFTPIETIVIILGALWMGLVILGFLEVK